MGRTAATTSSIDSFDAKANPTLARVRCEWEKSGRPAFEEGKHYRTVCLESGSSRSDLPIFASLAGAVQLEAGGSKPPVTRTDAEGVAGGFVLHDVLSPRECDDMVRFAETCGYTEDAPVSLGRHIRQNENCVWLADDALTNGIFERCKDLFPKEVEGGEVCGLNARWRLYKYNPSDIFRPHTDGSWPGSGLDAAGHLVRDRYGDRWSQLTIVIYLNDEFEGGPTRFFYPVEGGRRDEHRVAEARAPRGGAVCFFHGEHPLSPLHEGGLVTKGTKYIIRSDVLYKLAPSSGQDGWRAHYAQLPAQLDPGMLQRLLAAASPDEQRQLRALLAQQTSSGYKDDD
eukprot:TRINITY_DN52643_c0_g1_i1.p1 TRINITY_DN52643_c0_g1~~TRINITY_DN52643_c0_g1_i1.p1  ORF type:complete len:342 (-),score=71.31 TRINITY_DN52643_c0_g1_i1:55-1080(-)